jgi:phenylacetate-CoA ligase
MLFNPEIEQMPLPQLRALQNARLKEQVAYVYERVPFYKRKFDELGVHPSTFRGLADLGKLGFTKKTDFRDNYPFGLFAVPEQEVARLHCSSGTTGKATVVGYTTGDLNIFAEVVARSLAAAGCRPGMKMQNAYGYGLFTGGLGIHYGAEKLGLTVIPVSGDRPAVAVATGFSARNHLCHALLRAGAGRGNKAARYSPRSHQPTICCAGR